MHSSLGEQVGFIVQLLRHDYDLVFCIDSDACLCVFTEETAHSWDSGVHFRTGVRTVFIARRPLAARIRALCAPGGRASVTLSKRLLVVRSSPPPLPLPPP